MHIELGDIIKINSPELIQYHENIFLVIYVDNNNLQIKNIVNNSEYTLLIENSILLETLIISIDILKKHNEKGFVLQNELVIGSWIDIQFDVELPFILTGKITNTDEDMIELQILDNITNELSDDVIFIDFAYKGIPKDLNIKEIILREKPNILETIDEKIEADDRGEQTILTQVLNDTIDIDKILEQGEDLEVIQIKQIKNIENRKFGLGSQINDIIDDLLAIYSKPTKQQLNNVHMLITRYKELFINHISSDSSKKKFLDKNLIHYNWITPVIVNKPKLYDVVPNEDIYIQKENAVETINTIKLFNNLYIDNSIENKYQLLLKYVEDLNNLNDDTISTSNLYDVKLDDNMSVILDNSDFNSLDSYCVNVLKKDLNVIKATSSFSAVGISNYFNNFMANSSDIIKVKSLILLPLSYSLSNSIRRPTSNILFRSLINSDIHLSQYSYLNKKLINKSITNNLSKSKKDDLKNLYDTSFLKKYIYLQNELTDDKDINNYFDSIDITITNILNISLKFLPYNKLSFYSVLKELIKLNVSPEFINSYYYDIINSFNNEKIILYKQKLIEQKTSKMPESQDIYKSNFYTSIKDNIINYIDDYEDYTNSELIGKLINDDNMNNFVFSALSNQINILDVKKIEEDTINYLNDSTLNIKLKKCEKYYLAKKYDSLDELSNDNEITEVLFDSDLDPTNYNLLNDELKNKSKDAINFLIEKYKFTKEEAKDEYDAIVKKKRIVKEGHFALLENNENNKIFIRNKNNIWELTTQFNGLPGSNIFCNFQKDCFRLKKGPCSSINEKSKENKINLLQDMLGDIDSKISLNKENFKEIMKNNYLYSLSKLKRNIINNNNILLDTNNIIYNIGLSYVPDDYDVSPFYDIFQSILLIDVLENKYELLIKFCNKYTRGSNLHLLDIQESQYWRYCIKTNIKLVPTFLLELAISYVTNNNYSETIRKLCKEQGAISDDGDKIVDIYSGYKIKDLELNEDSFFTGIIEKDIIVDDNKINISKFTLLSKTYIKYVINIIDAISKQIYLDFSVEIKENIIKNVSDDFMNINVNPDNKFAEKQLEMLEVYYISYLTISYITLVISSNVPSFKAKKQFPGCIKSFNGWPVSDKSDNTLIEYLSCVIFNIKMKSYPWKIFTNKSLHSNKIVTQTSISDKIVYFIESYLLEKPYVQSKITNKINNLYKDIDDTYEKYNLQLWNTFLPPQEKLKINFKISKNYSNLTQQELITKSLYHSVVFFHKLQNQIENNISSLPNTLIDPTLSKINDNVNIYDTIVDKDIADELNSLYAINDIYKKHNYNTFLKIISKPYTHIVHKLNILENLLADSYLQYIFLYKIFLERKHRPFLLTIFNSLPTIKILKSFNTLTLIDNFKEHSIIVNEQIFISVFNYINLNNNIEQYSGDDLNEDDLFSELKIYISNFSNDNILDKYDDTFLEIMTNISDLNISDKKFSSMLDDINNTMYTQITESKDIIIEFIMDYVEAYKLSEKKTITEFISNYFDSFKDGILNFWSPIRDGDFNQNIYSNIEDESLKYIINYNKNALYNLTALLPNIIINNLRFNKINIPQHWDLSEIHNNDISNFIKKSFQFTKNYHEYTDIFKNLISEVNNLSVFIKNIVNNIFDNLVELPFRFQYLFFQYLLSFYIIKLINIIDDDNSDLLRCISTHLYDFFHFIGPNNNFKHINTSYDINSNIVNRVKDSEKNKITDMLKDMSKEQRRVDDEFKRYGIGFWSKGKEKGLRIHQNDKYDNDRLDELDDKDDFMNSLHGDIFSENYDNIDDLEANDMSYIPDDDEFNVEE